jgi:hypothetical protein
MPPRTLSGVLFALLLDRLQALRVCQPCAFFRCNSLVVAFR